MHILPKIHRSPGHIAKSLREELLKLDENVCEKKAVKNVTEIDRLLTAAKEILCDLDDNPRLFDKSSPVMKLTNEFAYAEIAPRLIAHLQRLPFESRKKVAVVVVNLLRRKIGFRSPTAEILKKNPDVLVDLIEGYENHAIAPVCGIMLRECARHESLAKEILNLPQFYNLFSYIETPSFEISADAFTTFKLFMQENKRIAAVFLFSNFDLFFSYYQLLLTSDNCLTRREALRLLGSLLKEPVNSRITEKYVQNVQNFRQTMWALIDKSPIIQWEAYEIFKVFLSHPARSKSVTHLLVKNREKLALFMDEFVVVKKGDAERAAEKEQLMREIQELGVHRSALSATCAPRPLEKLSSRESV